jgi:hypothetical protein
VVPPNAADRVALSKVSAFMMPAAESCSIWAWASTPPGSTSLPVASISLLAGCKTAAQCHDGLAGNTDIGGKHIARCGDGATADYEIVDGIGQGQNSRMRSDIRTFYRL